MKGRGLGARPRPPGAPVEFLESWLHSPTPLERLFGLWAIKAGLTTTTPQYYAGPRSIPYHSIHLVIDGAVQFRIGRGEAVRIGAGGLFCLFPDATCEYWASQGEDPPRMLWLALDGPAAGDLVHHLGLTRDDPCLRGLRTAPFLAHLPALRAVLVDGPGHRDTVAVEFLARFVGELDRQTRPRLPTDPDRTTWVRRAKALFDVHFVSAITVAEVADLVGIERSHFSKAFSASVGESPSGYLRSLRMKEGRRLLRAGDLSVTEIALSVGYSDIVAFSRAYHRHFGVAPSEDRDGVHQ